jgi:hypothetical protein
MGAKILIAQFHPTARKVNHISSLAPAQILRSAAQAGILFEYEA